MPWKWSDYGPTNSLVGTDSLRRSTHAWRKGLALQLGFPSDVASVSEKRCLSLSCTGGDHVRGIGAL